MGRDGEKRREAKEERGMEEWAVRERQREAENVTGRHTGSEARRHVLTTGRELK